MALWEKIKKTLQSFGSLFMEKNDKDEWNLSLGRVSFWIVFIPAVYIWVSGNGTLADGISTKDISPNHLAILLTMITYNFGKKVSDVVKKIWGNIAG